MKKDLSGFGFVSKYIKIKSDMENPKMKFSEIFDKEIISISKERYNRVIAFIIGERAPVESSNSELCFLLKRRDNYVDLISHEEINKQIHNKLSLLNNAVPAIVLYSWISPYNALPPPDLNICPDTFFCHASNNTIFLPQGVHHHQLVHSLFDVLKQSPNEPMLLIEFFTDTRDNYLKHFPTNVRNGYYMDTTFYSKNTLRYPVLIKVDELQSKTEENTATDKLALPKVLPALFLVVCSSTLLEIRWSDMRKLIGKMKELFKSIYYTIGEDIILTDQNSTHRVPTITDNQYRSAFILLITTGSTAYNISFADGNEMNVNKFSNILSSALPKLPKVIFSSHLIETMKVSPRISVQEYEHMIIVHSIEPNLSNSSFISNFSLEIQSNYFAELHSILRSSAIHSTQSHYIQIVDGFRKNFYINYHGHLAQLLNKESDEFKRNYENACLEGTEPFKFYRLMIVGPEDIGKTSLLRVLTGQTFREDEKTTDFLNKYNLLVQKLSLDWSEMQDLDSYIQNIEDTHQDLALKIVARKMAQSQSVPETNSANTETQQVQSLPSSPPTESNPDTETVKSKIPLDQDSDRSQTTDSFNSAPFDKINATLNRIQSLRSKTDFFTAWDFAGQNYLYCFHSLFLSPRSVYLILVDLTIDDLNKEIEERHRDDRHEKRSQSGVPKTYIEVYEFWLNAIYSVSKTGFANGYHRPAKIIFVFSKADKVDNAEEIASIHLRSIKSHMYEKNNSFSLVHGFFIVSCKSDSKYFKNLPLLKATIKKLSDQVAFKEPIPIRWLTLANDILRDKKKILDLTRIKDLAVDAKCNDELQYFLHFFTDIGFFFYKQGKVIIDTQKFLNLIYYILFPQSFQKEVTIDKKLLRYVQTWTDCAKLSLILFEHILDTLELSQLKESLINILLLYGIIIPCEKEEENVYIPYLLTESLEKIKENFQSHSPISSFFIFFPDGFLPASLYFTLLSRCLRTDKFKVTKTYLGFDCAIFNICESLLVTFDFTIDHTNILVSFYLIDCQSRDEEAIKFQIVAYLQFLQLSLVEIQTNLIPCGILAKIMFVCDSCKTISQLKNGGKPICSLDSVFNSKTPEIISHELNNRPYSPRGFDTDSSTNILENVSQIEEVNNKPIIPRGFCCLEQLKQVSEYIHSFDILSGHQNNSYKSAVLQDFILSNRNMFTKDLNWVILADTLYSHGLINIHKYSTIIHKNTNISKVSEDFLISLVQNGPTWGIRLYSVLKKSEVIGHITLVKHIKRHFRSLEQKKPVSKPEASKRTILPGIYTMNMRRHGIAFIVNIESFDEKGNYPDRVGSNYDVTSLVRLFDFIQYDTKVFENLTRLEYIRAQREIQSLDHSAFDSFFCVIMSHGNEKGEVIFSNSKPLSKCRIVNEFSPPYCKDLESKPKIFIFQACRGTKGKVNASNSDGEKTPSVLLENNLGCYKRDSCNNPQSDNTIKQCSTGSDIDTFIGDSTVDQHVSFRNESGGTFFIQSFCSVMESCSNMEFTHIMMEVRMKVSLISNIHNQCTEDTNRLKKQVYF